MKYTVPVTPSVPPRTATAFAISVRDLHINDEKTKEQFHEYKKDDVCMTSIKLQIQESSKKLIFYHNYEQTMFTIEQVHRC